MQRVILATCLLVAPLYAAEELALPRWLVVSGDLRLRLEAFDGEDFNDRVHDGLPEPFGEPVIGQNDEWILTRARLRLDAQPADWVRGFLELTDARLFEDQEHYDQYPGTAGNWEADTLDIWQGFLDFKLRPGAHLKVGRQTLNYGAGRVLSEYDWWNAGYSFDAARLQLRRPGWDVDLFTAQYAVNDNHNFNDTDDSDPGTRDDYTLYGAYATYHGWDYTSLDLYFIYFDNDHAQTHVPHVGSRLYGNLGERWDYDLEGILQPGGEVSGRDLFAWSVAAQLGYTFTQCERAPRVFAGYDFATGDRNPKDNQADGFFTFFADNYSLLGNQEFVMRRNLHAAKAGAQSRLWGKLSSGFTWRSFWTAQDEDQWYGMYHQFVLSRRGRSVDNHMGDEVDVYLTYPIPVMGREVNAVLRYSHFFAGDLVKDVYGQADDADEAILMLHYFF